MFINVFYKSAGINPVLFVMFVIRVSVVRSGFVGIAAIAVEIVDIFSMYTLSGSLDNG